MKCYSIHLAFVLLSAACVAASSGDPVLAPAEAPVQRSFVETNSLSGDINAHGEPGPGEVTTHEPEVTTDDSGTVELTSSNAPAVFSASRETDVVSTNQPAPPLPAERRDYVSSEGLDRFRIIYERNIFNPNRTAYRPGYTSSRRERDSERRVSSESFGLLGTMSYEKGRLAFFDGTRSEYHAALKQNDTIAGYTIAEISYGHVTLQQSNRPPVELPVGMQMKRQNEEEWKISASRERFEPSRTESTSSSNSSSRTSATSAPSSAGTGSNSPSGEMSDVLKKLMQKREEELNNEK